MMCGNMNIIISLCYVNIEKRNESPLAGTAMRPIIYHQAKVQGSSRE